MNPITQSFYEEIKGILAAARSQAYRAVNITMVLAYWQIGRRIVEEEQQGKTKAGYGEHLLEELSGRLTTDFGKGFDPSNLRYMRLFYLAFDLRPSLAEPPLAIRDALRHELAATDQNGGERNLLPPVRPELSWTHYRLLLKVEKPEVRRFYLEECVSANWSTRQLERQINSFYYERLLASRDREPVRKEIHELEPAPAPEEFIKDPYVLEFLDLRETPSFREKDLEAALIEKLQDFLLELGKGFSFVARQKRFTCDGRHFYIDLVFYNYLIKCFVLIDLKIGELTHQDLGQMQMYVNYYTRELTNEGDSPPLGIILCADKSDAVVRYTLPEGNSQIFASRYKLYLTTEEELRAEILKDRELIERRLGFENKKESE